MTQRPPDLAPSPHPAQVEPGTHPVPDTPSAVPDLPLRPASSRRRAWLRTVAAAAAVLIYLLGWSVWATANTTNRYRPLPPGATAVAGDGEFALVSLRQSVQLAPSESGREPETADPGSTFVVAELSVVPRTADSVLLCGVELVGPDARLWTTASVGVPRALPLCPRGELVPGRRYRFEAIFAVPTRYVGEVVGVAVPDRSTAARTPVLRPAG